MQSFGRMQEQRGTAGRGECGGDLAGDESALAHAGYNDAAGTATKQIDGALEGLRHGAGETLGERS